MAYLLSGERPLSAARRSSFARLARWLARARARRLQRIALIDLLELDAALLDDLGINRQDVLDAMRDRRRPPDVVLAERRTHRARARPRR